MQHQTQTTSSCFLEGVDARARGRLLADNPYCIRTDDHEEWQAGWHAILDLDEDDDPDSLRVRNGIEAADD